MRAVLTAIVLVVLASVSNAAGLVQITLNGSVTTGGGAPVQLEITAADPQTPEHPRVANLELLLAEGTTAKDLAALLARRLDAAGIGFVRTESSADASARTSIFVEQAMGVGVRLGNGLSATITLCDAAPTSARLSPGLDAKSPCQVSVVAHTQNAVTLERKRLAVGFTLEARATLTEANSKLALTAIGAGWRSELKSNEWWLPKPATEHGNVTGCTLEALSVGDWRFDVTL